MSEECKSEKEVGANYPGSSRIRHGFQLFEWAYQKEFNQPGDGSWIASQWNQLSRRSRKWCTRCADQTYDWLSYHRFLDRVYPVISLIFNRNQRPLQLLLLWYRVLESSY